MCSDIIQKTSPTELFFSPIQLVLAEPILRHVTGVHGVEVNTGITALGKSFSAEYSRYVSLYWQLKVGLGLKVDKLQKSKYKSLFTQPVIAYTLYTNHRNLFINVFGGANLYLGSYRKKKANTDFNVGAVMGGEVELFLFHNLELVLSGGGRYFFLKNSQGAFDYFLNLGIRLCFY